MAKKKVSKASKRRLVFFGTLSVVVIVYFLFSLSYNAYKIYSLKNEEKQLNDKLEKLQKEEKTLSNDMEKLQDPEYLAKYAREAFSYSKKDEIIIQKYTKEKKEKKKESKFSKNDIYIIVGCIIAIFIIMLYIVIKSKNHKKRKIKRNKKK